MELIEKGKLIDASELSKKVFESDDTPTMKLYLDLLLLNAPAIDAVPVVRCKDCRFDGDEDDCPLLSVAAYTNPDDFCSYGERKEGSDVEGDRGV